ncbi:MAG: hypothetical protein EOP85_05075 [Verrucomicrobiaceae bacterium]|nr:MAG: hypothetical protein EOP85_05075 [Verrucomicrobiaceae bacterium]
MKYTRFLLSKSALLRLLVAASIMSLFLSFESYLGADVFEAVAASTMVILGLSLVISVSQSRLLRAVVEAYLVNSRHKRRAKNNLRKHPSKMVVKRSKVTLLIDYRSGRRRDSGATCKNLFRLGFRFMPTKCRERYLMPYIEELEMDRVMALAEAATPSEIRQIESRHGWNLLMALFSGYRCLSGDLLFKLIPLLKRMIGTGG